jgi:hypothetical protein
MALSISPCRVFWCEPSGRIRRYLRCYQSTDGMRRGVGERADDPALKDPKVCAGYCNAMRVLDEVDEEWTEHEGVTHKYRKGYDAKDWPFDAFPTTCERCGREMEKPERQVFVDEIMVVKTGERAGQTFVRRELPVGAMFNIDYYNDIPDWCGRDGLALNVVTPGGEWHVDSRANNCTLPDDHEHRCWVRSGDPRTGYVHVDKDSKVQRTCQAGGGSIWINKDGPRDWHGFLHRGYLIDADDHSRGEVDRLLDAGNPVAPAERAISPVRADMAKARRKVPVRPTPAVASTAKTERRWRSNR